MYTVHKALNDKLPASITDKYRNQISKQNLRSTSQLTLNIPIHKTQKYQLGPLYRTLKSWNNTSVETRTGVETNTFKKLYQTKLTAEIWPTWQQMTITMTKNRGDKSLLGRS